MNLFPDNSRVIFTGDSITSGANYTTRVTEYYRKNLPERNVKFYQAAIPGNSLPCAIRYFNDLILPFKPTHATVFFGINDSGRGYLNTQDEEKKFQLLSECYESFKTNLSTYIDLLLAHNITPILFTLAPYAEYCGADTKPLKGGHRLSYEYAEVIRAEAERRGLELVDLHSRLSELYLFDNIYIADRIHLTDRGQYRIAECILRSQGLAIGEYRPIEDIVGDDQKLHDWHINSYRIGRLYGMYVCVKPDLYEMSVEEQLNYVGEFVVTHGYGENVVSRDFSTEFAVLKPKEAKLFDSIRRFNGDI